MRSLGVLNLISTWNAKFSGDVDEAVHALAVMVAAVVTPSPDFKCPKPAPAPSGTGRSRTPSPAAIFLKAGMKNRRVEIIVDNRAK